jgi:EAL domain-containing protein (putative c-di-GMP-specific phosphodiesterase class I)
MPVSSLKLGITENSLLVEPTRALDVLHNLRRLGTRVGIDDFGTGFSSLAYLKRLPIDEIKIDKGFVLQMAKDETDSAIVRSTIGLAHELGLSVVAEGVETQTTWNLLADLGCDTAQGFFLSPPIAATGFIRWLDHAGSDGTGGISSSVSLGLWRPASSPSGPATGGKQS